VSCSQPIIQYDKVGHLELVGYSDNPAGPDAGCGFSSSIASN